MRPRAVPAVAMLLILAVPLLLGLATARADDDHDRARRAVEQGSMLPLRDILARAQAVYPGQIVSTELETEGGIPVYEIKIVSTAGRLTKLHYDARNGTLLRSSDRGAPR